MYHIEKEIDNQFDSISKTVDYVADRREEILRLFKDKKKIRFIGSGSSYLVAQSASLFFGMNGADYDTYALPAGDLMLNFNRYKDFFKDSIVVCLTRSGSTTELIKCLELLQGVECQTITICARKDAETSALCDMSLEIEWAFDQSVCQTQTVTNLYSACLALGAITTGNDAVFEDFRALDGYAGAFRAKYEEKLKEIGRSDAWDCAVTLADSECSGLIAEGALAFQEISQNQSGFYNILDVRHGPVVMFDKKTLIIMLANGSEKEYKSLVADLKKNGSTFITIGMFADGLGGDFHLELPCLSNISVAAILAQYAIQVIACSKALVKGIDPDNPAGLNPWVELT